MENEIFVLNPDYIIKDDVNRFYLYSKLHLNSYSSAVKTFLHPMQAFIFSFFSVKRSLKENILRLSDAIGYTEEDAMEIIKPFIENKEKCKLTFKGKNIYIPQNFLINIKKLNEKYTPVPLIVDQAKCYRQVDLTSHRLNRAPGVMTFMLTNRCVTKCCYCYADTQTKVDREVPTQRIVDIIREAKKLEMHNIFLIGGEVFLHKDWDVILKEIIDNGFEPDIISTKVPITNEIVQKLKNTGYNKNLQLSIDSIDPEILTPTLHVKSNYIDRIMAGIDILEKTGIKYKIETVLTKLTATKENVSRLYNYLSTLKQVTYWEIRIAMYSNYKDEANFLNIKSEKITLDHLYQFIEKEITTSAPFPVSCPRTELNKVYHQAKE